LEIGIVDFDGREMEFNWNTGFGLYQIKFYKKFSNKKKLLNSKEREGHFKKEFDNLNHYKNRI
jgi:hypothetical protein